MVAYSFKERFVEPIRWGLGLGLDILGGACHPKRQTIRSHRRGRSRHAQPGDELQLYTAMRTKYCRLIGKARCTHVDPLQISFTSDYRRDRLRDGAVTFRGIEELNGYALLDGFTSWCEMRAFWSTEHPGIQQFDGVVIRWEPLP